MNQYPDRETWLRHIKPAADFILVNGPDTQQERWEEKPGYSPSTIAAEIAALTCAANIASLNRDRFSAGRYLKKADEWVHNVDRWTRTTTGPQSDQSYYLRISDDEDPNDGAKIEINSGGGTYDEREIVDAGFLELVRLGIKPPADPSVINSLAANEGMMIPEQIWDRGETPRADLRFGAGTGSATPLAWSMPQFIRLAINLQIGHNSDTPAVVAARYAKSPGAR